MNDALLGLELVDLLDVDGEASGGVEASRAEVAFEVLRLLVLNQNYVSLGVSRAQRS